MVFDYFVLGAVGVLSAAAAAFCLTITKAKVSEPFREWVKDRSPLLGELVSCPYCFSHWVSLFLTVVYQPYAIRMTNLGGIIMDPFVTVFLMVACTSFFVGVIYKGISVVKN